MKSINYDEIRANAAIEFTRALMASSKLQSQVDSLCDVHQCAKDEAIVFLGVRLANMMVEELNKKI